MEAKKSPKADLENKRGLFIQVGLVAALLVVIGLFSWSQSEKKVDMLAMDGEVVENEMIDVTVEEQKPQEPVKVETATLSNYLQVVKNDAKIEQELTFLDDFDADALANMDIKTFARKEEAVQEEMPVFDAEEMPKFQGKDLNAFRNWVQGQIVYPSLAAENGVQGRVSLTFVVEKDGSVTNVAILRGVDRELDAAAIKAVQGSPKWTPGKTHGKPVRIRYNMPVDFILH